MYVCTSADRRRRRPNDHDDHRHCYSYIILRILLSSALPVISALHYQRARYHRVQRDSGISPVLVLVKTRVEKLNLVLSCPPIRGEPTIRRYQRRRGESTGAVTVNKIGVARVASRLIRGRACLHSASCIPSLCALSNVIEAPSKPINPVRIPAHAAHAGDARLLARVRATMIDLVIGVKDAATQ